MLICNRMSAVDFVRGACRVLTAAVLLSLLTLVPSGCGGGADGGGGTIRSVQIAWIANPEAAVNRPGGGYQVYYSTADGFSITDPTANVVDVPYSSGTHSPTSTTLQLFSGRNYVRVVAYSSLNRPGSSGGSRSAPSAQLTVLVP
jgi:hypothetical protein